MAIPPTTRPLSAPSSARRRRSASNPWIALALGKGARGLVGGERRGAVVPPTLLADVEAATPLGCQEVFGR